MKTKCEQEFIMENATPKGAGYDMPAKMTLKDLYEESIENSD